MNNTEQGTATIPLSEYNRLKLIEKALEERKSIWLSGSSGTYFINEDDSNKVLFDKIKEQAQTLDELHEYKHQLFMKKFKSNSRLVFW